MTFKRFVLNYVAPTLSALLFLTFVRFIDTTFLLPVTVFDVQKIQVKSDAVYLSGRIYKPGYRASCQLESVQAVVNELDVQIIVPRLGELMTTRPPGWTSFSDMRIPGKGIRDVTLTSRHTCYGRLAWAHSTKLAVLKVEPLDGNSETIN